MHNPAMVNLPIHLPPFGRIQPASDFLPIDVQQPPPPMYLHHRHPSRYRNHHAFAGNQFYNRTKRKRDSSMSTAAIESNGYLHRPPPHHSAVNGVAVAAHEDDDPIPGQEKPTPWNTTGCLYSDGIIGLHEEIEAFVQWMVPTRAEHDLRLNAINRLRAVIKEIYPSAAVRIFGSFSTGLYLPTSDIDLVLVGSWEQIPFEVVRRGIEEKNLAKPGSLQLLEHATVPIIKLTDRLTDIKIDISFNMTNGLRSVELIKHFKKKFPAMQKLIYVLKQFLLQRDLNEVYTGGLSSYALILMVVSFLQLHPRGEKAGSEKANLGVLLVEFFELYGRHFNYSNTAIIISDGGAYVSKDELRGQLTMGTGLGSLCIQDPYLPDNDIGKSSYGIPVVKTAFEQAYLSLTQFLEHGAAQPANGESLLSQVVRVSDDIIAFRRWVASSSLTPFSESDVDKSSEANNTSAGTNSNPLNGSNSGKQPCVPENNDDQALSDDPRLPNQITPTPSRDVLPRELPSKVFGGKKSSSSADQATTTTTVDGGAAKDNDNMSGVSTTTTSSSSSSASSHTDTDSDVIASGSPSSAMSISPASSEVGIRNSRVPRHANCHHRQAADSNDKDSGKFKQPGLPSRSGTGNRFWNSGNRKSTKERSDLVMNWRNAGPDQNSDWRNHDLPSRPNQERKNSRRDESSAKSSVKSKGTSGESSCAESEKDSSKQTSDLKVTTSSNDSTEIREPVLNRVPAIDEPVVVVVIDDEKKPESSSAANQSGTTKPATDQSAETCCSNNLSDQGFVKVRTMSSKKRKKQNRAKNKNNVNNSATTVDSEPAKAGCCSNSSANDSSMPQDRFSTKSRQSKPNR